MKNTILKRVIALATVTAVTTAAAQVSTFAMTVDDSGAAKPSEINVEWYSPAAAASVEQNAEEFIIHTSVNGQAVSLSLSFPSLGGIRLCTDRKGFFEPEEVETIAYAQEGQNITMKGKDVTVKFLGGESPWAMEVSNQENKTVRRISAAQIFFGYQGSELKKVKLEGGIAQDEKLYGLGERFNSFDQVGASVLLWNRDSYNDLMNYDGDKTKGYKNVPILHSSDGYTLFFNSYYAATADIGKTDSAKYSLDFNGPKFDFYLWTGDPLSNIQAYTDLTGKPVLPPKWAFQYYAGAGGQVWDAKGKGKHLDVLKECMDGYASLGTPIAALFGEGSPSKDADAYQLLKKTDTRMLAWYWSAMGEGDMFKYLPGTLKKDVPRVVMQSNPNQVMKGEYIDFTNPISTKLMQNYFKQMWGWGLRGSMVDFGDNIYEDSVFSNGMTGDEMHNAYAYWYNKGYHDAWEEGLKGDYILFSRSGAAGSQQWIAQFGGDHPSTFQGMKQAVLGGLSASTAGFSVWGSDIGGYGFDDFPPTPDCYMRWLQFGTFSPLMRTHGTSDRNPWTYGKQAEQVFQSSYWLRENLLDYIYSGAVVSHKDGVPMMQPMAVAFPQEKELAGIDDQYMFCGDFLVAPVTGEEKYYREVVFPQGNWVDLWTGAIVQGGQTAKVSAPQEKMPVYLRAGSAFQVQLASTLNLADSMLDGKVPALLAAAGGDKESTFWTDEETSVQYTVKQQDGTVTVNAAQPSQLGVVILYGVSASEVLVGGKSLEKLGTAPTDEEKAGFYADPAQNRTVIRVPAGEWTELAARTKEGGPVNLASDKNVTASSERSDKFKAANAFDNQITTHWTSGNSNEEWISVDLGSDQEVGSVVLKWTNQYAANYKIQVGSDGSSWTDAYTKEGGFGGVESLKLDTGKARYVRLLLTQKPEKGNAELYGFEVYSGTQNGGNVSQPSSWLPAALIAAGTVLLAVGAVFLVLLKKRKKVSGSAT